MNAFIDQDAYLNQNKFRNWIEGILSRVAIGNSNRILLDGIPYPVSRLSYICKSRVISFKEDKF